MVKKKGRRRKKRTHVPVVEDTTKKVPKSFVLKTGKVGTTVKELKQDFKKVMEPNTAIKLKERKTNSMKDFLSMAGPLDVSHFAIFSATELGTYLRLSKVPRGPTLTFRVHSFTLMRDIATLITTPHNTGPEFKVPPLVVLNNFPQQDEHMKLTAVMFQGMFPPLNVQTMKVQDCRRIVLLSYDKETKMIHFRHYFIRVAPVGVKRSIKKILRAQIPKLDKYQDISDYVLGDDGASDSEREDGPENRFTEPEEGPKPSGQNAVRLLELGPRMELQLIKIQDDFCSGSVIFHEYVQKTQAEIAELKKKKEERVRLKAQRKAEQERNVKRKKELKDGKSEADAEADKEEEDDVEWYKREVGEEPEPEELKKRPERLKERYNPLYKKKKKENGNDEEGEGEKKKVKFAKKDGKPSFGKKRKDDKKDFVPNKKFKSKK